MLEVGHQIPLVIFVVGLLISVSLWIKGMFHRIDVPPLIGFVLLGWLLRLLDQSWGLLPDAASAVLYFLSDLGIITLLFRIGYESHIKSLVSQISRASLIAFSNILFTAALGYSTAYYLLNLALVPSLFIAIALTATSIGITISIWEDKGRLDTREGNLLLDLVALDDIIAIILMGLLFNVAPILHVENSIADHTVLTLPFLAIVGKLLLIVVACTLFSLYIEERFLLYLKRNEAMPDPIITIAGIGFMIAAVAAFLGFSVALGAFLAGIAFSREPETQTVRSSLKPLEDFFIPFFFIGIGYKLTVASLTEVAGLTAAILLIAVIGKVVGTYLPARLVHIRPLNALILGISMIPRAEVALITMEHGLRLGDWAVSQDIYTTMVLTALITSLAAPLTLKPLFKLAKPSN